MCNSIGLNDKNLVNNLIIDFIYTLPIFYLKKIKKRINLKGFLNF